MKEGKVKVSDSKITNILVVGFVIIISWLLVYGIGIKDGYSKGIDLVYYSLTREVDLTKVPVKGKALFEMRVRAPYERSKRGIPYLVPGTTELVLENQIEEKSDEK